MAKDRLQQFIAKHEDAASKANGFAHEIHLDFIQLAKILAVEFDHKKDKAKSDLDKLFGGKIPSQKELLFLKFPNCAICGKKFTSITDATKDHIKPKAKGGKNDISNYQLLCGPCNSRKGDYYDPEHPNEVIYKKNRPNVRFMLEESNYIDGVHDKAALEEAYLAWNYLWPHAKLTPKAIKRAHFRLMEKRDCPVEYKGQLRTKKVTVLDEVKAQAPLVLENMFADWCEDANSHTTYAQIVEDHVKFERMRPFMTGNGRMGRILMNWQLAKAQLPLNIVLSKDKEEYFKWFKEKI